MIPEHRNSPECNIQQNFIRHDMGLIPRFDDKKLMQLYHELGLIKSTYLFVDDIPLELLHLHDAVFEKTEKVDNPNLKDNFTYIKNDFLIYKKDEDLLMRRTNVSERIKEYLEESDV